MIEEHELELLGALKEKKNLKIELDDKEYELYFKFRKKLIERVRMIFDMHKQMHHCMEASCNAALAIIQPFEREVWVYKYYQGNTKVIGYPFDLILEADIIKLRKRLETLIF